MRILVFLLMVLLLPAMVTLTVATVLVDTTGTCNSGKHAQKAVVAVWRPLSVKIKARQQLEALDSLQVGGARRASATSWLAALLCFAGLNFPPSFHYNICEI